jgi:hypothetical protein
LAFLVPFIGGDHPLQSKFILPVIGMAYAAFYLLNLLMVWIMILQRLPTAQSVRICSTVLQRQGFVDITPDKFHVYSWRQINKIVEHQGDIYFWGNSVGNFIPRSAFPSLGDSREFYQTAVGLWKDPNYQMTYAPPSIQNDQIWPPPPQR